MSPKSFVAQLFSSATEPLCCFAVALGFTAGLTGCPTYAANAFIDGDAPAVYDSVLVADFETGTQGWGNVRLGGIEANGGVLQNSNPLGSNNETDAYVFVNIPNSLIPGSPNTFTVGELPGQYDIVQFDLRFDTLPPTPLAAGLRGRQFLQNGGGPVSGINFHDSAAMSIPDLPLDNDFHTYTIQRDFNDNAWEQTYSRIRIDPVDNISNVADLLGANFSIDNVRLARTTSTLAFPEITPVQNNIIRNGDVSDVSNAVFGSPDNDDTFNINGGNGNFGPFRGNTGDVDHWTPYNNNPDSIVEAVNGPDGTGLNLLNGDVQGSFYLDTHRSGAERFVLNSAGGYLNGLTQTDVLSGIAIDDTATYELSFETIFNENRPSNPNSDLIVALTVGQDSTDPNTAVAGSLFDNTLSSFDSGETQTVSISGAALKAAQDSGDPVNLIVQSQANTSIVNFPGTPVPNNHVDGAVFTQVQLDNFSLVKVFVPQTGDLNKDGFLTTADLTLAQDYLAGNGGETAQKRQDDLFNAPSAPFEADILESLNLTDFDLTGDDYFDAADITALEALLPTPLDGDYNGDGIVDAADYTVWRDGGSPDSSQVGYDLWAANYGASQTAAATSAAVPEPTALVLLGLVLVAAPARRRA